MFRETFPYTPYGQLWSEGAEGVVRPRPLPKRASVRREITPRSDVCATYLPAHVAASFESQLCSLVERLGDTHGFKGAYLRDEFRSKYLDPQVVSPSERRDAAIKKWLLIEERNAVTNRRVFLGDVDFGWVTSARLLRHAARTIKTVLGDLRYPGIFSSGTHTNGASTRVKRGPVAAIEKFAGSAHVSSSALPHWHAFAEESVLECQPVVIRESSELFTVDKSTDIDRVACKEPEINMFLQRAVGNHIRKRLRAVGVDLNDQTVNQRLARSALADGLATIDLSSASDSISTSLVLSLLPFDWYSLLDDLRVKSVKLPEGYRNYHELEMFSSMGNGFTFELESLIFWSLTRSVMYFSGIRGRVSVYGDDIICPAKGARRIARVFHWLGFRVNAKKSNWTGGFRESCGKHYYHGLDVTPFYLRGAVSNKMDVIHLLNRLFLWDDDLGCGFIATPEIIDFHQRWSRVIPQNLWGGQDRNDPSCLVTGHPPRSRLTPVVEKTEYCHLSALKKWLLEQEDRRDVTQRPLDPSRRTRYQVRRCSRWTVRAALTPWLIS